MSARGWILIAACAVAASCNSGPRAAPDGGTDAVGTQSDGAGEGSRPDVPPDAALEVAGEVAADVETEVAGDVPADVAMEVAAEVSSEVGGDAMTTDGSEGGATDGTTDGVPGPIVTVSSFGCFARSGDGNDYFPDGTPATLVTNSPWRAPCDLAWIGLNANGYTKPTTPTTETLARQFVVDSLISDRATITVSFEVDDAAEIVLNGKLIASCTPPAGNAGECQSYCHVVTLSRDDLRPVGQVNVLEMKMVNLQNTSAPGGNTGYTGISYSICAMGE